MGVNGFQGMVITQQGLNLLEKAQTGTQLKLTRVAVGDGNLSCQGPTLFTQLIDQIMSLNISGSSGDTADGINNLIQLYIGSNSQSNAASCQNFRIYIGQVFSAGTVNLN